MSARWLDPLWAPEWKQGPHTLFRLSNYKLRTLNLFPLSLHKHLSHNWDSIVSHVFRIIMYENYIAKLIRINIHLFIYLFIYISCGKQKASSVDICTILAKLVVCTLSKVSPSVEPSYSVRSFIKGTVSREVRWVGSDCYINQKLFSRAFNVHYKIIML